MSNDKKNIIWADNKMYTVMMVATRKYIVSAMYECFIVHEPLKYIVETTQRYCRNEHEKKKRKKMK